MQVLVELDNNDKYRLELAPFEAMTEPQIFQQFLNHFRTNGFWNTSEQEAIMFTAVRRVSVVKEKKQHAAA